MIEVLDIGPETQHRENFKTAKTYFITGPTTVTFGEKIDYFDK